MDQIIKNHLLGLIFGEYQEFKNMAVYPLIAPRNGGPEYLTLKEALEKKLLSVTEVGPGGSVPELKVTNKADISVLLLDGEEVIGAKQNRVLNTTILVKEKTEVIIPVSCTEQGRWTSISPEFRDSDTVANTKLRRIKAQTVASSLQGTGEFRSDQGTVWNTIDEMSAKADVKSRTHAMKDVFEQKMKDLDEYIKIFQYMPHQGGLLALINGEVVGFDFVSREKAYEVLHPKLVKSYAMEAILESGAAVTPGQGAKPAIEKAKAFLNEATQCEEKKYKSVGKGQDYRFEGKQMVGSALEDEGRIIHLAFFMITESEKAGEIAAMKRRRGFRI
jgi:hypothetical protein